MTVIVIEGSGPKNVMIYGHVDKQPHMEGWEEGLGATKPVIKNDRLYGRGGAGDGYSFVTALMAVKALED